MTANRATDSLRGSVKTLKTKTVSFSESDPERYEAPVITASYDEAGNKIEEAHYQSNNSLFSRTVWSYDSAGKLVEQSLYGENESLDSKIVFEYDSENRLIERKFFDSNGNLQRTEFLSYTAAGLRIEEETLPEADADIGLFIGIEGTDLSIPTHSVRRLRKVYDRGGKPLQISLFDQQNSSVGKISFVYDAKNRLIEVAQHGSNDFQPCGEVTQWQRRFEPLLMSLIKSALFLKCVYSFGLKGELSKVIRCFTDGSLSLLTVYLRDENGRVAEEQTHFVGLPMMKKTFAYDDKGNKTEETFEHIGADSFLEKQIFTREYDAHGNWVKEIVNSSSRMENELRRTVTRRDISYYPD